MYMTDANHLYRSKGRTDALNLYIEKQKQTKELRLVDIVVLIGSENIL